MRVRKFTLPDVREGSVIEYAYTVTSDFLFNFQDWTFQRDIPVRWSEYRASIPEYFDYKMLHAGLPRHWPCKPEKESTTQFTVHTAGGFSGSGLAHQREAATNDAVTARATNYRWVMKNVPAFPRRAVHDHGGGLPGPHQLSAGRRAVSRARPTRTWPAPGPKSTWSCWATTTLAGSWTGAAF